MTERTIIKKMEQEFEKMEELRCIFENGTESNILIRSLKRIFTKMVKW